MMSCKVVKWVILAAICVFVEANDVQQDPNAKAIDKSAAPHNPNTSDQYKKSEERDEFDLPDVRMWLVVADLIMEDIKAFGLSEFKTNFMINDLKALQAYVGIKLDEILLKGTYTLEALFPRVEGPFTIIIKDAIVTGNASLRLDTNGYLRTKNLNIAMIFSEMIMDYKNLNFLEIPGQLLLNSSAGLIYNELQPALLTELKKMLKQKIDTSVEKAMTGEGPSNSVSPLDMIIAEGRKKIQGIGYDPYKISDKNCVVELVSLDVLNTTISGLSSFYRLGDMEIFVEDHALTGKLYVATPKLLGSTEWKLSWIKSVVTGSGHVQFTVEYIKALVEVSQPMDTKKPPKINDLHFDIGDIQVQSENSTGDRDFITSLAITILPEKLHNHIAEAMQGPVKAKLLPALNEMIVEQGFKLNVEKLMEADSNF